MKTRVITGAVLAAGLLVGGSAAHADELVCNRPVATLDANNNGGRGPTIESIRITYNAPAWRVEYAFTNGKTVVRNDQYALADITKGNLPQWGGRHYKVPKLYMVGTLGMRGTVPAYRETLFDTSKPGQTSDQVILDWEASCSFIHVTPAPTPQPPPVIQASAPQPAPSTGNDSVPFFMIHGAMHVQVNIGGILSDMTLDTGANVSSVTPAIADQLIAAGKATEMESVTVNLADGSNRTERMVKISYLTIGSHTRTEVAMTVSDGEMLLGLPVLNAIGRFTIDAGASHLIFG